MQGSRSQGEAHTERGRATGSRRCPGKTTRTLWLRRSALCGGCVDSYGCPAGAGCLETDLVCFALNVTKQGADPCGKEASIEYSSRARPTARRSLFQWITGPSKFAEVPLCIFLGLVPVSEFNLTLGDGHQIQLHLADLISGAPGITPAFGESLAEAAGVCLEDRQHSSPTSMQISGDTGGEAILQWQPTTVQAQRCWNDDEAATEHGAYGIATLLVPRISDLQVVQRSKKGTGFDYWLGTSAEGDTLFQNKARLEVSGIRAGSEANIAGRVRKKIRQTQQSSSSLEALVVVVEFGGPESRVARR